MSLEQSIQNLADAINAHSQTLVAVAIRDKTGEIAALAATAASGEPKRGPGRPKKTESAPQDASPVAAAVVTPAAATVSSAVPVAAAGVAPIAKSDVSKVLVAVVQKISKDACVSLCNQFGAPNLSGIDPDQYPELLAAANALLESVGQ